jgi:phosphatidylinositol kinase/protein kinase (PI-3  family)
VLAESTLPCFAAGEQAVDAFRTRFQTTLTDQQAAAIVEEMITASCNNVYTNLYDQFNYYTNGILI